MQTTNTKQRTVFAVDIGGSKLLCGFVLQDGSTLDTVHTRLTPDITTDMLEGHILDSWKALREKHAKVEVFACGMTIPGVADAEKGIWTYACFSGISDYPIAANMREKLGMPVFIENDGNACAWAERVFGVCKDCGDFMWITVSNGVGGGIVLNGKLYRGFNEGAGEFGHLIIEPEGRMCPCGHRGCMEAMAAGPGIAARYKKETGTALSAKDVADRMRGGEKVASKVMYDTGVYLGRGLGKSACILNVKRYVLGGGVMQSFGLLEKPMREAFFAEAFARPNKGAEIMHTGLGYEAALLGAAAIAFEPVI